MSEDYLKNAHAQMGVAEDFEGWKGKISTNDDYLSKMHESLGVTKDFADWKGKVIGNSNPEVPAS